MGTLIGMFLVAGLLSIPNGQYAIEMTRKGHGATAINNTFSSQILNISVGLGVPLLIAGVKSGEGVVIPANKIVSWSAILLALGSLAFIGMTLVPAMVKKLDSCTLSSLSGQILVGLTVALMVTFAIISLILRVSLTNSSLLCKCTAVLVLGYLGHRQRRSAHSDYGGRLVLESGAMGYAYDLRLQGNEDVVDQFHHTRSVLVVQSGIDLPQYPFSVSTSSNM